MNEKRVVVTGMGIIAPNGIGKEKFWDSILTGRSGIKEITSFDVKEYPVKIAGEVDDFRAEDYMERKKAKLLSRFSQISLTATKIAVDDSKLNIDSEDPYRVGISLGTAIGGLEVAEKECCSYYTKGMNTVNPFSVLSMNPNSGVGIIAFELKIKGPNMTISTGCSAGLSAIGHACDVLNSGRADVMIAGGAEAPLFPVTFESFCASHVLTTRNDDPEKASRPFERKRDGYVLGEGAGMVILETLEHALKRGARIYAEVGGYGMTNDGYSMFKMEPSGKEAAKAINMALENAGLLPENINYINAHGSSSVVSDIRETAAIKDALGGCAYGIPISSIKSTVGQSLAASAAMQFLASVMVVDTDHIPPTINYEEPDPACDLDYVPNIARNTKKINSALINSFGAGGNNISMVLKKYN